VKPWPVALSRHVIPASALSHVTLSLVIDSPWRAGTHRGVAHTVERGPLAGRHVDALPVVELAVRGPRRRRPLTFGCVAPDIGRVQRAAHVAAREVKPTSSVIASGSVVSLAAVPVADGVVDDVPVEGVADDDAVDAGPGVLQPASEADSKRHGVTIPSA